METARQYPMMESTESLEERVRRLEETIARLPSTDALVDQVVERFDQRDSTQEPPKILPLPVGIICADEPAQVPPPPSTVAQAWTAWTILDECWAMFRMYFNPRFNLVWWARLLPFAAVCVMILSALTVANIWVIGWLLDKIIDVIVIAFCYRALAEEAKRFRQSGL